MSDVVGAYRSVLVPEANLGQLARLIRADYLVDAMALSKVQGGPFRAGEIEEAILARIDVDPADDPLGVWDKVAIEPVGGEVEAGSDDEQEGAA